MTNVYFLRKLEKLNLSELFLCILLKTKSQFNARTCYFIGGSLDTFITDKKTFYVNKCNPC